MASPVADHALARRLEACHSGRGVRYYEAALRLGDPGADPAILHVAGGSAEWLYPGSVANSAGGLGMDGPVRAEDLDRLEDFYHSRGSPVRLMVCPLADSSLLALVRERGYRLLRCSQYFTRSLPLDYQPEPVAGVQVEQIGLDRLDEWVAVAGEGFDGGPPSAETRAILRPNGASGVMFLASIDGQPAGAGGLYVTGQSAELGGSSTRAAFRHRGVHQALVQARMAAAAALGCDLLLFSCDPGAASGRNAARAGFWLAYTGIVMEV